MLSNMFPSREGSRYNAPGPTVNAPALALDRESPPTAAGVQNPVENMWRRVRP
jgi:hypothetical protein